MVCMSVSPQETFKGYAKKRDYSERVMWVMAWRRHGCDTDTPTLDFEEYEKTGELPYYVKIYMQDEKN